VSAIENPPAERGRRIGDRGVAVFMTVTLVLFAVLVGLVVYLVTQVSTTMDQQQAAQANCRVSNANRQEDVAVWNRLLDIPTVTAAAKAEVADLKRLVRIKDTPHECG
jgi:Na+/H+-dicarboxylate symporter